MPVAEKEIVITRLEFPLRHKVEGAGWMAEADAVEAAAIKAMDAAGLPVDTGRDKAAAVVRAAGIRINNARLSAAVKKRKNLSGTGGLNDQGK